MEDSPILWEGRANPERGVFNVGALFLYLFYEGMIPWRKECIKTKLLPA